MMGRKFPLITHLIESLRVKVDAGPLIFYRGNWDWSYRFRLVTRPTPHKNLTGLDWDDCREESQELLSCFMPIASLAFLAIFRLTFGEGKC